MKKMIAVLLACVMALATAPAFPVLAEDAAAEGTTKAITENKAALTTIPEVTINVEVPDPGTTVGEAQDILSFPEDANYSIAMDGGIGYFLEDPLINFEPLPYHFPFQEGVTYYMLISLEANSGYMFQQGDDEVPSTRFYINGNTLESEGFVDVYNISDPTFGNLSYGSLVVSFIPGESDTVSMTVRSDGHGKVKIAGVEYDDCELNAGEGDEVEAEAIPDEGYQLESWWIRKAVGNNTRSQETAITLIAGSDIEATAYFALEKASLTIIAPEPGSTAATAPQIEFPDGAGYSLDPANTFWDAPSCWVTSDSVYSDVQPLDESTVFLAGHTYYAYVRLTEGTDSFAASAGGSSFNTDLEVSGGTKKSQGNFAAWSEDGGYMGIMAIIAVTIPEGHSHTLVKHDKVTATCGVAGAEAYWICSECGKMFSDESGTHEITAPVTIPARSHSWGAWKTTKAPTATSLGVDTRTCSICKANQTKTSTPTGATTILNTIANSAKKTNDVIWDKSKVKGASNYQINWRARGASTWASRNVGNTVRGTTSGLTIGNLYEIRVRPYAVDTATKKPTYGSWSNTVYRYFHTTEKIRLASRSKGTFTMSWKVNPKATSYQVLYTTNKNGSGAANNIKTVAKGGSSITVSDIKVNGKTQKLKSGTTYYVQVREICRVGNTNYIGNISIPVAVKVK